MSDTKEYEARTGRSAFFRIHKNDAGTEAYQDHYVHDLQAEIERLRERVADAESVIDSINNLRDRAYEEMKQERDEAREAARWMAEGDPSEYELKRWPWLEDEKARES